jgi:hypothetical protein
VISHKYRCIFVHQRKSAGTSVKALFPDATGEDRGRFTSGVLDPEWRTDNPLIRDYHTFTVVRNPWDRFVSAWKFCRSTRDRPLMDVFANLPRERLLSNILAPGASLASRRPMRASCTAGRSCTRAMPCVPSGPPTGATGPTTRATTTGT